MWGAVHNGQLGIRDYRDLKLDRGGFKNQPTPKKLNNLKNKNIYITKVICGDFHTIFLSKSGEIYSCGDFSCGQLRLGNLSDIILINEPKKIEGILQNKTICFIASGSNHVIVIDNDNNCYGLGDNTFGQLEVKNKNKKIKLPKLLDFVKKDNLLISKVVCRYNQSVFFSNDGSLFF